MYSNFWNKLILYLELIPAPGTLLVSTLYRGLHCSVHTCSAPTPSILSQAIHFPSLQYIEHDHTTILGTYSVWFLITWGIYKANPQPKVGRQFRSGIRFRHQHTTLTVRDLVAFHQLHSGLLESFWLFPCLKSLICVSTMLPGVCLTTSAAKHNQW